MARTPFHRDFTLCRAAVLAGLIGAALALGGVPSQGGGVAQGPQDADRMLVPAALFGVSDCPASKTKAAESGIAL